MCFVKFLIIIILFLFPCYFIVNLFLEFFYFKMIQLLMRNGFPLNLELI